MDSTGTAPPRVRRCARSADTSTSAHGVTQTPVLGIPRVVAMSDGFDAPRNVATPNTNPAWAELGSDDNEDELVTDGGEPQDRGDHRSIAREHLLGATVWAYGGGGARVRPWTQRSQFSHFGGVRELGESRTDSRPDGAVSEEERANRTERRAKTSGEQR